MIDTSTSRRYDMISRLAGIGEMQWQLVAQAAIPPSGTVLEIGTGTGNVALRAKRAAPGATVIGLDPDGDALAAARRKSAKAGLELRLDQGRAGDLPYPDGSVDRVLSSLMFHHLEGDERLATLREIRRVLAPGGSVHLVDLTSGRPGRPPLLLRLLFSGRGRGPNGHGATGHGQHGHGHGHGHGHDGDADLLDLMHQATLTDPVEITHGTVAMGGTTFYRATRD